MKMMFLVSLSYLFLLIAPASAGSTISRSATQLTPTSIPAGAGADSEGGFKAFTNFVQKEVGRAVNGIPKSWTSFQECNRIRKKKRESPLDVTYEEFDYLQRNKGERLKVSLLLYLSFQAPNNLPYLFLFYDDFLPTAFKHPESLKDKLKKLEDATRRRTHLCLNSLCTLEELAFNTPNKKGLFVNQKKIQEEQERIQTLLGTSARILGDFPSSLNDALTPFERFFYVSPFNTYLSKDLNINPQKRELKRKENEMKSFVSKSDSFLPKDIFKNMGKAVGMGLLWRPVGLKGEFVNKVKDIADADEFLVGNNIDISKLDSYLLREACSKRFIGSVHDSDDKLVKELKEWLDYSVVKPNLNQQQQQQEQQQGEGYEFDRIVGRTAMMMYHAVKCTRAGGKVTQLPQIMYGSSSNNESSGIISSSSSE